MSLVGFIREPDVRNQLSAFRANIPRTFKAQVKVKPRSERRAGLIGIAFDYLLRFEIHRRHKKAICYPWVAEFGVQRLLAPGRVLFDPSKVRNLHPEAKVGSPYSSFKKHCELLLEAAKQAVRLYRKAKQPTAEDIQKVAFYSLCLANLDAFYRTDWVDVEYFCDVTEDEIEELVEMLDVVPFEALISGSPFLLNPNFEHASQIVGGADADLISGTVLLDFKTTQSPAITSEFLDQLLGYFLLSRKEIQMNLRFPSIKSVGLYFARFAYLFRLETAAWLDRPDFTELEKWFFLRAQRKFGSTAFDSTKID